MKKICLRFFVCLTILGGITLSGCIINVDTGDGTIRVYNNTASVDITYAELLDEDGDMVKEAEGIKAGKSLIFTDIKSGSYTVYIETSDNRVYESDSLLLRNGEEKDFDFTNNSSDDFYLSDFGVLKVLNSTASTIIEDVWVDYADGSSYYRMSASALNPDKMLTVSQIRPGSYEVYLEDDTGLGWERGDFSIEAGRITVLRFKTDFTSLAVGRKLGSRLQNSPELLQRNVRERITSVR